MKESWPTIVGLEEEEVNEELKLEKEEKMEESWPTIVGLEEEAVAGERNAEDNTVQGEPLAQALEPQDAQESLLVIPGLERIVPVDSDKAAQSDVVVLDEQTDDETESLGELRFADPD